MEPSPTHDEPPAIGDFQGTFPLDGFGKFHGLIDDLRIYDRGLSGNEIARVYTGDVNNTGAVEYRAIEKTLELIHFQPSMPDHNL